MRTGIESVMRFGNPLQGQISSMSTVSAPSRAAAVRSAAACSFDLAGKSSLPRSRMLMLSKSIGQKGKSGRSCLVA